MEAAPFHADLAEGPEGGRAVWLTARDGVRIRAAVWRGDGRGTVFLLPGRCEYVEKYGRSARVLTARGYDVVALDFRGQGMADRLLADPQVGHVRRFADYQLDIEATLSLADAETLAHPFFMIAHSMGGCIGLRTLQNSNAFSAAAFSAPMWGIAIAPALRHPAKTLPWLASRMGLGGRLTPTTKSASYLTETPFEGNFLTTDEDMWNYMVRQSSAVDSFRLGGPSLTWLGEALAETRALHRLPRPSIPAHASVGTREKIVEPHAVETIMEDWPAGTFTLVDEAEHELMMERPEVREAFFDRVLTLFAEAA